MSPAAVRTPPSLADLKEVDLALLEEEIQIEEARLPPSRRRFNAKLREWKRAQPLMTFRLRQGVGSHTQTDPDGVERTYLAREGKPILSPLNLAEHWPDKYERIDGFNTQDTNPFLNVPAPGELPEDFQRRMERLKAQGKLQAATDAAAAVGVNTLDPFMDAGVEVGVKPHPQTGQVTHVNPTGEVPNFNPPTGNKVGEQGAPPSQAAPAFSQRADLEKMTVTQLKEWANNAEITLSPNLNDKAKIITEIRRGMDRK